MAKKIMLIFFLLLLVLPFLNANASLYIKKYDANGFVTGYVYIPDNAYLNYKGDGYFCEAGYVDKGNYCEKIKVPKNATFNKKYNEWYCNIGILGRETIVKK